MQSREVKPTPLLILRLFWFALNVPILFFIFVSFSLYNAPISPRGSVLPNFANQLEGFFVGAALLVALANVFFLSPAFLKKKRKELLRTEIALSEEATLKCYYAPFLFFLSLNELVVILGFFTTVVSSMPGKILPFALFACFLNFQVFPWTLYGVRRRLKRGRFLF